MHVSKNKKKQIRRLLSNYLSSTNTLLSFQRKKSKKNDNTETRMKEKE